MFKDFPLIFPFLNSYNWLPNPTPSLSTCYISISFCISHQSVSVTDQKLQRLFLVTHQHKLQYHIWYAAKKGEHFSWHHPHRNLAHAKIQNTAHPELYQGRVKTYRFPPSFLQSSVILTLIWSVQHKITSFNLTHFLTDLCFQKLGTSLSLYQCTVFIQSLLS